MQKPADLVDPVLTENAIKVMENRYLIKDKNGVVAESPGECFWRVAWHIAGAEDRDARELWARRFYALMQSRKFMPNSPTIMNAGRSMGMLSACFVLPVEDSVDGIFQSIRHTALIQKAGGGTGFSFTNLRPKGDRVLSSGGTTEGPLSFIEVFSKATDAIQQGAFRRGANMAIMNIEHPDVLDFITFKDDLTKIQNYNISVAISNTFIDALRETGDAPWYFVNPRTKEKGPKVNPNGDSERHQFWTPNQIWDLITEHAHRTGEPGLFFIDRANKNCPVPHLGRIVATNPCGEQNLHNYDSCNLGSMNVGLYVVDGRMDWDQFKEDSGTATRFLDNVVTVNNYPIPEIADMAAKTRRIGLGVMGVADAMYKLGLAYNSPAGTAFGETLMERLYSSAVEASRNLCSWDKREPFGAYEGSTWEDEGIRIRNSYLTTVAPTGTISIIAGCSGGIEPMFSLAFKRQVMKDTDGVPTIMHEVNYVFEETAKELGFWSEELIEDIAAKGTIQHRDDIPEDVKHVFVTAHDIEPEWHMQMQECFQVSCDSAISKTINFPHEATVEDVREIYRMALQGGIVKGVTVYRDGCRDVQPMALSTTKSPTAPVAVPEVSLAPEPEHLPDDMLGRRIRQVTPFGNMHVHIAMDANGNPREVFAQLGKAGELANSDLEGICRLASLWLRAGGDIKYVVKQLEGIGSTLTIPTADGRIMSLPDALARALRKFLGDSEPAISTNPRASFAIKCPSCTEGVLAQEEGCSKCYSCGYSQC